jgi:hypothetical protein
MRSFRTRRRSSSRRPATEPPAPPAAARDGSERAVPMAAIAAASAASVGLTNGKTIREAAVGRPRFFAMSCCCKIAQRAADREAQAPNPGLRDAQSGLRGLANLPVNAAPLPAAPPRPAANTAIYRHNCAPHRVHLTLLLRTPTCAELALRKGRQPVTAD